MAITGASGARYGRRLAQAITAADAHLHLIISPAGRRVLADELGLKECTVSALFGRAAAVTLYAHDDIGARIASGSFPTDGMVVCPCSGNTLAGVAGGLGNNLVTRAALVTLKEARRLVLVPREMPLSQIDLANMLRAAQAGAVVCPASPGFYLRPQTIDDLVDFVVGRVLDLLGVRHELSTRWDPRPAAAGDAPTA
jgi:4-hydroxy-3-polyprenylbenzoate decarboxylase